MRKECDSLIGQCRVLCNQLIRLAEKGMSQCDEDECLLLFGMMLDSGYKLKAACELRRRNLIESHTDAV